METEQQELQAAVRAHARARRAKVLAQRRAGQTLAEIAQELNISTQRVSRLEQQALEDEAKVSRGTAPA